MPPILRFFTGQARNQGRLSLYIALATTGYRFWRRLTAPQQRTLLRFEVKPGEVYELRGVRRGQ